MGLRSIHNSIIILVVIIIKTTACAVYVLVNNGLREFPGREGAGLPSVDSKTQLRSRVMTHKAYHRRHANISHNTNPSIDFIKES